MIAKPEWMTTGGEQPEDLSCVRPLRRMMEPYALVVGDLMLKDGSKERCTVEHLPGDPRGYRIGVLESGDVEGEWRSVNVVDIAEDGRILQSVVQFPHPSLPKPVTNFHWDLVERQLDPDAAVRLVERVQSRMFAPGPVRSLPQSPEGGRVEVSEPLFELLGEHESVSGIVCPFASMNTPFAFELMGCPDGGLELVVNSSVDADDEEGRRSALFSLQLDAKGNCIAGTFRKLKEDGREDFSSPISLGEALMYLDSFGGEKNVTVTQTYERERDKNVEIGDQASEMSVCTRGIFDVVSRYGSVERVPVGTVDLDVGLHSCDIDQLPPDHGDGVVVTLSPQHVELGIGSQRSVYRLVALRDSSPVGTVSQCTVVGDSDTNEIHEEWTERRLPVQRVEYLLAQITNETFSLPDHEPEKPAVIVALGEVLGGRGKVNGTLEVPELERVFDARITHLSDPERYQIALNCDLQKLGHVVRINQRVTVFLDGTTESEASTFQGVLMDGRFQASKKLQEGKIPPDQIAQILSAVERGCFIENGAIPEVPAIVATLDTLIGKGREKNKGYLRLPEYPEPFNVYLHRVGVNEFQVRVVSSKSFGMQNAVIFSVRMVSVGSDGRASGVVAEQLGVITEGRFVTKAQTSADMQDDDVQNILQALQGGGFAPDEEVVQKPPIVIALEQLVGGKKLVRGYLDQSSTQHRFSGMIVPGGSPGEFHVMMERQVGLVLNSFRIAVCADGSATGKFSVTSNGTPLPGMDNGDMMPIMIDRFLDDILAGRFTVFPDQNDGGGDGDLSPPVVLTKSLSVSQPASVISIPHPSRFSRLQKLTGSPSALSMASVAESQASATSIIKPHELLSGDMILVDGKVSFEYAGVPHPHVCHMFKSSNGVIEVALVPMIPKGKTQADLGELVEFHFYTDPKGVALWGEYEHALVDAGGMMQALRRADIPADEAQRILGAFNSQTAQFGVPRGKDDIAVPALPLDQVEQMLNGKSLSAGFLEIPGRRRPYVCILRVLDGNLISVEIKVHAGGSFAKGELTPNWTLFTDSSGLLLPGHFVLNESVIATQNSLAVRPRVRADISPFQLRRAWGLLQADRFTEANILH